MTFRTEGYQSNPDMRRAVGAFRSSRTTYMPWRDACLELMPKIVPTLNDLRQKPIIPPVNIDRPHMVVDVTAGGPFLLRDAEFRDSLKQLPEASRIKVTAPVHPKLVSVEMESHGFMNAAHEQGIPACVIKGICDDGDDNKGEIEKETGGYYRAYACSNAILAVLHILDRSATIDGRAKELISRQESTLEHCDSPSTEAKYDQHNEGQTMRSDAHLVLSKIRHHTSGLPGVVGIGLKEAIVVSVEEGYDLDLPKEIDNVAVVFRVVSPIMIAAGPQSHSHSVIPIIVAGENTSGLGAIVIGPGGDRFIITAAHVVEPKDKDIEVVIENRLVYAHVHERDYTKDIALLKLELKDELHARNVSSTRTYQAETPNIGQDVTIRLPEGSLGGKTNLTHGLMKMRSCSDPENEFMEVDGVFMIETNMDIKSGQSGALVTTPSGSPLGLVVGVSKSGEGETLIAATSIRDFLNRHSLRVEMSYCNMTVGILINAGMKSQYFLNFLKKKDYIRSLSSKRVYLSARIEESPNVSVFITEMVDFGSTASAIAVMDFYQDINPDIFINVGLAGGISDSVHLGDVVVSDSVIYETRKKTGMGTYSSLQKKLVNPTIKSVAQKAVSNIEGQSFQAPDGSTREFKAHVAPIASVDKVFAFETENEYKWLLAADRKILAVEMEGSGILAAADHMSVPYLLIRGIADKADNIKNDEWYECAAKSAAFIAIEIAKSFKAV